MAYISRLSSLSATFEQEYILQASQVLYCIIMIHIVIFCMRQDLVFLQLHITWKLIT